MQTIDVIVRDCVNAILPLRSVQPGPALTVEAISRQAREHIDKMSGRVLAAGLPREDSQRVSLAVVCLADSLALKNKSVLQAYWRDHLLQSHYFGTGYRANAFFDELDHARKASEPSVVKAFATALALGYRGQMRAADAEKLVVELVPASTTEGRLRRGLATQTLQRLGFGKQPLWIPAVAVLVWATVFTVLSALMRGSGEKVMSLMDAVLRSN